MGFYPLRSKKYQCFYYLSTFLNIVIGFSQVITMMIQLYFDRNNLLKLTESLLMFLTHFTFICKLLNFQVYKQEIAEIEDYLKDPVFNNFTTDQLEIIKERIRFCDIIANIFRFCCANTIIFYLIVPFLDPKKKGTLPMPAWFPYDIDKFYFPTYFLQVVCISLSAVGNTAMDILTWKLISIAAAQFEILKNNLSHINFETNSNHTKKVVVSCVYHHRNIISLTKKIQYAFSKGMFLQLFCSIGVICTNGFHLLLVPVNSGQFVSSIFYLFGMICQIFTYCWYSHDLMTTSDGIGQSLYMSNWYLSEPRTRKMLLIIFENVKNPVTMRAGNFVTLSLVTFTQIMRNAYSYFAVLQHLYNK